MEPRSQGNGRESVRVPEERKSQVSQRHRPTGQRRGIQAGHGTRATPNEGVQATGNKLRSYVAPLVPRA
jgi:hypothetical protein